MSTSFSFQTVRADCEKEHVFLTDGTFICFLLNRLIGCGHGWCFHKGSCYQLIILNRNYANAEAYCVTLGAHLAEIQSEKENMFIAGLAPSKGNVWIGFSSRTQNGHWIWTNTQQTGTYTNWATGQPNGRKTCAILWSGQEKMFWDDIGCHHKQWFVCEKGKMDSGIR